MELFEAFDPFDDDIVREPRTIEAPVESLNARALARLLAAFQQAERRERRVRLPPPVQLVTSPEPGYGKSHLLGRLFRRLEGRATLIYLRPFQDPESCWIQVLNLLITELDRPDRADSLVLGPDDQTQLSVITRRILSGLAGGLVIAGEISPPAIPAGATPAAKDAVWKSWMAQHFEDVLPKLDHLLAGQGVQVQPNRRAWLRVLYAYAFPDDADRDRQTCLDWLQDQPLDMDEGREIRLRPADLPPGNRPHGLRNDSCFARVRDLLHLGVFYRPFLFCFDQTELYGASPALARSFGVVLSRLRRECVNHLTVVTGNRQVWEQNVACHFERADRDVLAADPVRLEGMTRRQAEELVQGRRTCAPGSRTPEFTEAWFDRLFAESAEVSVRGVLRRASQHWNQHDNPPPPPPIAALFDTYRRRLIAQPDRMAFDAGVFQWVVQQVLSPAARADPTPIRTDRGYLTLRWDSQTDRCYFGFEPGNHWRRWEAIIQESQRYCQQEHYQNRTAHAVFFRTSDQKPLPKRNRKAFEAVDYLRLFVLTVPEMADFFAAHDLHADAAQGDQSLRPDEVLAFLRERFAPWVERIRTGRDPPPDPPELQRQVACLVERTRLITVKQLIERISDTHVNVNEDQVLDVIRNHDEIRAFVSPRATLLQWVPCQSA